VRSLTSDFSEASGVSSTAMSQAATLASGGSRSERESARRERAKRKEKCSFSTLKDSDAFHADKENVQNSMSIRARASHSQRGLRAKGLARFDLSAAPSLAATSMSVGFVAAGELPQGLSSSLPPSLPLSLTPPITHMGLKLRCFSCKAHAWALPCAFVLTRRTYKCAALRDSMRQTPASASASWQVPELSYFSR
jgi:hypothetical protein